MKNIAFITSINSDLGLALAEGLLRKEWYVFAGFDLNIPEKDKLSSDYSEMLTILPLDLSKDASIEAAFQLINSKTDYIDLIINTSDIKTYNDNCKIRGSLDFEEMTQCYEGNAIGQINLINTFLPLTDKGNLKRLCFITSKEGSINQCRKTNQYGYSMARASANMTVALMFNVLRPEGYTFRLFDPTIDNDDLVRVTDLSRIASSLLAYFLRDRFQDVQDEARKDDNRLVARDWRGREISW